MTFSLLHPSHRAIPFLAAAAFALQACTPLPPDTMQNDTVQDTETSIDQDTQPETTAPADEQNIVEIAVAAGDLSTLVAAVQAADLAGTLSGPGPFTVFAPVDQAFASLPAGTVETLLQPENQEQLASVLTYHVVPGSYTAADLQDGMSLQTVNGQTLTVSIGDGGVSINGSSTVLTADIMAENGVIHLINAVLMPSM